MSTQLEILRILRELNRSMYAGELSCFTGIRQAEIAEGLAQLTKEGLVASGPDGWRIR